MLRVMFVQGSRSFVAEETNRGGFLVLQDLIPALLLVAALVPLAAALVNYRLAYSDRKRVAVFLRKHHPALVEKWFPTSGPWREGLVRVDHFPECHLPALIWRRGVFPDSGEVAESWARVRTAVIATSVTPMLAVSLIFLAVWFW